MRVRNALVLSLFLLSGALLLKTEVKGQTIDSGNVQINTLSNVTPNNAAAENNTFANLFLERSNHTLASSLAVDFFSPLGSYNGSSSSVGSIAAGTIVNSYWLNVDKVGSSSAVVSYSGQITFQNKILGVIFNNKSRFASSTSVLGNPGTTYPGSGSYGPLEATDTFSVTNGGKTLSFSWRVNTNADQMRIITAVPEPAFYQLGALLAGGGLLFFIRRRQQA
jgi:hypothetical protein